MLSIIDKISNIIGIDHFNPYIYVPIKVILSIVLGGLLVVPINKWFPWANGKLQ